ncbi:AroM family protein [Erwinia sp. JUb26]|uniref:AroM family protein n=1 Tax=Erwinia sp. JUb26 TaxID=2485126 RepID=UPI000F4689DE|nr:AroM family protein [Erwinia sp. JUb26]ROR06825.1 protein AroM [Erwinia sp. JUb26]
MNNTLVTLTPGQSTNSDIVPLLLEHLPADRIVHSGLLDGLTLAQIEQLYGAVAAENVMAIRLNDGSQLLLSAACIERGLQQRIDRLEEAGYEIILLLSSEKFSGLTTRHATLLEPDRIVPPLVEAIVEGHQVGIMLPQDGLKDRLAGKWKNLSHPPCFAVASPEHSDEDLLIDAALSLQEQGADVVVLDSIGYQQRHRDFLQKLLGIPVLLPNVLVARLAAELLL